MEIKSKLRAIFQLVTRRAFRNLLLTDFNMHWLHSELQTIVYTDLSLSAHINLLTCLSLSLCALCSSSSFFLASSCSLSSCFCSKLLKIQVTLLNFILFHTTLQGTMQHAACTFDPSDIPWILQKLLFSHTSFWREDFLNIFNHLPDS